MKKIIRKIIYWPFKNHISRVLLDSIDRFMLRITEREKMIESLCRKNEVGIEIFEHEEQIKHLRSVIGGMNVVLKIIDSEYNGEEFAKYL
jgi:hypothetical protein